MGLDIISRNLLVIAVVLACAGAPLLADDVTPMDQKLEPGRNISILCNYTAGPIKTEGETFNPDKGPYHYTLYVPDGYDTDPKATFPCIFTLNPGGGELEMGQLIDHVKRFHYVVIQLNDAEKVNWTAMVGCCMAAYDDAIKRVRIQPGLFITTGFSGTARGATLFAATRPGFGGIILQAAGFRWTDAPGGMGSIYHYDAAKNNPLLCVYGIFGNADMNRTEAEQTHNQLPPNTPYKYEIYKGKHQSAPPEEMDHALSWIEEMIYFKAPNNPKLRGNYIQRVHFLVDQAGDATLSPTPFEKYECFDSAIKLATFRGILGTAELKEPLAAAQAGLRELAKDPSIKKESDAKADFLRITQTEDAARAKRGQTPQQVKAIAAQAGTAFSECSTKYPDTIYGKRAMDMAAMRLVEAE